MGTAGRWPWRSASAKKRVATYPPNRGAPKMDGADPRREAPDALRGRRARACRRSVCASVRGGARGADPGSSSISKSVQRRVRPRKEVTRRLQKGAARRFAGRRAGRRLGRRRQRRDGGNFPARASGAWCCERRVLHAEKDARRSYRTASGLWGSQPGTEANAGKGSRQNGWVTSGEPLALACKNWAYTGNLTV